MLRTVPCVLMRAGTSRGPFFLREWLPIDEAARDQVLIGAIGASDLLQVDGVGGGSTLTSKVAIVSRSTRDDSDVDYLFAQVGVGQQSVDTRANCGNMLSGVGPFAIEQGLVAAQDGQTPVRVFNVNTGARIDVIVQTPDRRVVYDGLSRIDGVAGTAAPIRLNFLDAWGAVTGQVFPTGRRIDVIDGVEVTCIDAAMPLMIVRAGDLGVQGNETAAALDANGALRARLEALRLSAGALMGLGDVRDSVVPKPVLVSAGDVPDSLTSRYFTPHRCHASHAVTGAIGVAAAFCLPGTVATPAATAMSVTAAASCESSASTAPESVMTTRRIVVLHPAGRIDVEVQLAGDGAERRIERAALLRTARKIFEGRLHLPDYVFPRPKNADPALTIVVPTSAGGANDLIARSLSGDFGRRLSRPVVVDNRPGASGVIAAEYVARAAPDGCTLMFGYIATHAMNPALQTLHYDPVTDFEPIGLVASSPLVLVVSAASGIKSLPALLDALARSQTSVRFASPGYGTAPHFAAELFKLKTGTAADPAVFPGAAPAIEHLLQGGSTYMFPSLYAASAAVAAGQLHALAVAGDSRLPAWPDLPTFRELGWPDLDVTQWYGLFAPAGTPVATLAPLREALAATLADPQIAGRLRQHGAYPEWASAHALRELVIDESARWRGVAQRAGLLNERSHSLEAEPF